MDFKEKLGGLVKDQITVLCDMAYEEGYSKAKEDLKQKQEELEANAYVVLNGDTYVDLEYEVATNRKRFGLDLNSVKRTYFDRGSLIRDDKGKYVPNTDDNTFIMNNGKLFINVDELSILYFVYSKQRMLTKDFFHAVEESLNKNYDNAVHLIYNISNVENKQRNPMYKKIREDNLIK